MAVGKSKKMQKCVDECPHIGDVFVCAECNFTIVVVKPCTCTDCECVCLCCCGEKMKKVNCNV